MALAGDQYAGFAYSFPLELGSLPSRVNELVRVPFTVTNRTAETAYLSGVDVKVSGTPGAAGTWRQKLPNRGYAAGASWSATVDVVGYAAGGLTVTLETADYLGDDLPFSWKIYDLGVEVPATLMIVDWDWAR
jgi:hypothetical protein